MEAPTSNKGDLCLHTSGETGNQEEAESTRGAVPTST